MKKIFALFLAVTMLASCLVGCGSDGKDTGAEKDSKSVELSIDVFPATLHPHEFTAIDEYCIAYQMYEPLVYVKDDNSEQFLLAESYDVSEDGLVYTFQLRSGVKFHNGEVMTADDVVFSFESALSDAYMATYTSAIAGVEKVDESTIAVTLNAPSAAFMRSQKYISILSKKFCEENNGLNSVACGTGPFALSEFNDGVSIAMTAFSDYWQGASAIPGVTYNYVADDATKIMSFESGDLTFITVPAADWDRISAIPDYKNGSATQDMVTWLCLNSEVAPLDNLLVRQAVYCAVDKESALIMAANGTGTVANTLADPRIINGATDDFNYLTYDLEKAKSLLAEAGYPDGVDLGEILYIGGSEYEKIAVATQSSLAEAGITVALHSMDSSAIFGEIASGNFTVCCFGSGLGRDYSLYSQLYTTEYLNSLDLCRLQDPEVDAAFAKAAVTIDAGERNTLYKELITKLETGAYYIPVYYKNLIWASDPNFTPDLDDGGVRVYYSTFN